MNKKFQITCPRCHRLLDGIKLGINSYMEFTCPHCHKESYAKSTSDSIRCNLLENQINTIR